MFMIKKAVFWVILISLVSLTALPLNGYCDEWVFVEKNEYGSHYYNPSSVKIDKQNNTIKVWSKSVYTEEGKSDFLDSFDSRHRQKYKDISQSLYLQLFDYNKMKDCVTRSIDYSKSGSVLSDQTGPKPNWHPIFPGTTSSNLFNKLVKDYNIQR